MVNQPMRIQRVRLYRYPVKVEGKARTGAGIGDPGVDLLRTLRAAELVRDVIGARHAAAGQLRIELEGVPAHLGLLFAGMVLAPCGECGFEMAFSDEAPWADHIGNYINVHGHPPLPLSPALSR